MLKQLLDTMQVPEICNKLNPNDVVLYVLSLQLDAVQ